MTNSLNQNAINQVYLSNSTERFVVSDSGDYYWWNDFNRSYQPIDTSSLPGQIIGVDSDNAGNLAFLTWFAGDIYYSYYLTTWNASSESLGESTAVLEGFADASDNPPFAYISSTEFLLISNGVIAQFTTDGDGGWDYVPIGPLGVNFASTIAGLDGSAWALDDKGQAWIIDETQVSLLNGSNNPPFKQLCVVDSQTIYGLDNNGNVYLWSSFANSFINLASTITNLPTFSQIQVDEQGILYGITAENTSYQVFDISAALSITNPNAPAFGVTTATDRFGVTHAIWNENGQIYYGYQQTGGNGQYIGVTPLNGGIGTANQGSSTNLTLTSTDSGAIAASWISGSNENAEVYTAQFSASPYGGYQWSVHLNITNDDAADSNLEVVALNNNRLLVTTQKKGKSNHRIVDLNQLALTPQTPTKSTFQPKGQGFTYQISAEDLASSSGIITLPSNFSLELGLGTGNLSQLSESVEKALNGWSLNIQLAAGGTTNKPSADSPFAYLQ